MSHPTAPSSPHPMSPAGEEAGGPRSTSHCLKSRFSRRGVLGTAGAVVVAAAVTPMVSAATNSDEDSGSSDEAKTPAGHSLRKVPRTRTEATTGGRDATCR
ncbi:hypothetical protein [Streptomyces sp. NPDC048565]|uniref:hypothetical protein n=1 Tax=Streptomyces sp. NPDC048565 TaxID=3155266 RepID=UPI00342F039F